MRLSEGVEWGVHGAVLLAVLPPGHALPAARLAEFHGVPAAYLAKHLQAMARAGLLAPVRGPRGGYRLGRAPEEITVLDVVEAIDGPHGAFRCTEIRQRGPAARPAREYRTRCAVHRVMLDADAAWRDVLAATTVAELAAQVGRDASPRALEQGVAWLQEVLR